MEEKTEFEERLTALEELLNITHKESSRKAYHKIEETAEVEKNRL